MTSATVAVIGSTEIVLIVLGALFMLGRVGNRTPRALAARQGGTG
jgi:hypothetical protein